MVDCSQRVLIRRNATAGAEPLFTVENDLNVTQATLVLGQYFIALDGTGAEVTTSGAGAAGPGAARRLTPCRHPLVLFGAACARRLCFVAQKAALGVVPGGLCHARHAGRLCRLRLRHHVPRSR